MSRVEAGQLSPFLLDTLARSRGLPPHDGPYSFENAMQESTYGQDSATGEAERQTTAAPEPARMPAEAVDAIRAEMQRCNLDAGGVSLSYTETPVYYPGGSYVNRLVTFDAGNGVREQFDAELTLKNPKITVTEIGRLLGIRL